MTRPTGPLLPVVEALDGLAQAVESDPARAFVAEVRAAATGPLRVAVAGRIKAGKSTLVNALLRQRVAPTDVGECTRLVTWYRFGVPEQLEVVRHDGTRLTRALQPDGSLPSDLPVPLEGVSHLEVSLSIDALRDVTLIDTPGLASASTASSGATQALLALDGASRGAVAAADVLVLVLPVEPRADEIDVLARFDEQFQGIARSSLNTVGVLSRIDQSPVPASEVGARAAALARRLVADHLLQLVAVLPVNGLLAETASCGVLTERDVTALRDLAALPPEQLRLLLLSADRFAGAPADVPGASRERLLALLDLHGLERSLELVATAGSSAALTGALLEHSGFEALHREVFAGFGRRAAVHKASWVLNALLRARVDDPRDAERFRDVVERLLLHPDLHAVQVLRAVQAVASGDVVLPVDLAEDLRLLADHVGLDPHGPDAGRPIEPALVLAGARRWRAVCGDPRSSPRVQEIAETACRAYENLL